MARHLGTSVDPAGDGVYWRGPWDDLGKSPGCIVEIPWLRGCLLGGDHSVGDGVASEVGGRMKIELLHQLRFVEFDRLGRDL